jgi:hypothetical protein
MRSVDPALEFAHMGGKAMTIECKRGEMPIEPFTAQTDFPLPDSHD